MRAGRRRAVGLATMAALLAGCVSVKVGSSDAPAMTYYLLPDARPVTAVRQAPAGAPSLAVQGSSSDPLADSTTIVFSRRPGERSLYQFASWTERPSRRLAQLAGQRLQASGQFASVTQLGQPVNAEWLLTLSLDTLVHDVSTTPGRAELVLVAELIQRRDRVRVARRVFSAAAPVATAAAPAAVAAFGVAAADVLDELTAWVEATVAANPIR
jgi:ABC-type uncharacterized transport system auxiliary subunit